LIAFLAVEFFLPNPRIPSGVGGFAVVTLVAFVFGGIVQAHASKATGDRQNFIKSIELEENQDLSNIDMSDGTGSDTSEPGPDAFDTAGILAVRSLLDPVFLLDGDDRGESVDDQLLASIIRKDTYMRYDLESNSETWDVLYRLMISEVDSGSANSIAIRMHALRNFYRGVWIAMWYILVLLIGTLLVGLLGECGDLPFTIQSPGYTRLAVPVIHLTLLASVACLLFRYLAEKRNEDFIEYLFSDYARIITNRGDGGDQNGNKSGFESRGENIK
jgi:hypothetical protein